MAERLSITFGAMAPPLAEQLKPHSMPEAQVGLCQRFADSIVLLRVHGVLTEREADKARKRLMGKITEKLRAAPGREEHDAKP